MAQVITPLNEKSYLPLIRLDKEIKHFLATRLSMLKPIDEEDISILWENLAQTFGNKFINGFGCSDNGVWFEVLKNLTKLELHQGFKAMLNTYTQHEREKKEVWPPNAKEFNLYCEEPYKPYNIPSLLEAYNEAQRHLNNRTFSWSHPVVFYGAMYAGMYEIKEDFWVQKISLFKPYYLMLSQLYIEGLASKLPPRQKQQELVEIYGKHSENCEIKREVI